MSPHTITIGDTTFDHVEYDRDADVLYLSVGDPRPAAHTYGTPEGHAVRFGTDGDIVGITFVKRAPPARSRRTRDHGTPCS